MSHMNNAPAPSARPNGPLTPMMEQYWHVKDQYPREILFYRMGDFYEMFYQDAIVAANDLGIALTRRGKTDGEDIPMCGVPFHSSEAYLAKLIQKGHRVAICEQMESPEEAKRKGTKGPLRRDVVRIVTKGTLTEENLLPARQNNYLVTVSLIGKAPLVLQKPGQKAIIPGNSAAQLPIGIAAIDISTGAFFIESVPVPELASALARLAPSEIVVPDTYYRRSQDGGDSNIHAALEPYSRLCTPLPIARFNIKNAHERLLTFFKAETLSVFGNLTPECLMAAGVALDYLYVTQKDTLPRLGYPRFIQNTDTMRIDAATRKSLELTYTQSGDYQGSLLHTIDRTLTAMGSRLLGSYVAAPLIDVDRINNRLDQVGLFFDNESLCSDVRGALQNCPDAERALSRLMVQRGGPRDMGLIRQTLRSAQNLADVLKNAHDIAAPIMEQWAFSLSQGQSLLGLLEKALHLDHLPLLARDGGFIADGFDETLDRARHLQTNGRDLVNALQERYAIETGISTLKIKHNHVLGYHIDIGPNHVQKVPGHFIHRQTLASSHRYTTVELGELEKDIAHANDIALARELALYADLINAHYECEKALKAIFGTIALLDVMTSHATLARTENLTRPIVDASQLLCIEQGRHPVVEQALKGKMGSVPFTANDCRMTDEKRFWLMTGPNMGGKSTYLRQNALIIIMAQMGMFVPAVKAHIGYVDRLSSRVGASDDLAAGRSTFMVEMIETAAILHQSTDRSFVILDEIGRGTSTYDGVAIALAVTEHLYHTTKCRALFATHYHELTQSTKDLLHLGCLTVQVEAFGKDIVFLHKVVEGVADRSYGVHVAARAGLPKAVIARAEEVLLSLEKANAHTVPEIAHNAVEIAHVAHGNAHAPSHWIEDHIQILDLNSMTPKEALDVLYALQMQMKQPEAA